MADPVVHITAGVPDSGTGNITTLGQTLVDGANQTIGSKSDAANSATDGTQITAMSIWKQISASVQAIVNLLPAVLGAGGGLKIDGSGTALPVTFDGGVTANAGTDLNTSALALESGGNLATVATAQGAGATGIVEPTGGSGILGWLSGIFNKLNTSIAVTGTFFQATQPVSAASLPLPTGAATATGVAGVVTALGSPMQETGGSVTANAGTNLNTSLLALESGGNLASIVTKLTSLVTGTILAAGSAIIGKVGIDQSTVGTTDSVSVKSQGFSAAVSVTRPANTTAYAANDVVGATAAAIAFASMGPSAKEIMITSAALEIDAAAIISGETSYRLYLYNVTPPSALADNAAFDLPSGDRASFLGYIDLGAPVDIGSTLYVETNQVNKQLTLSGTSLFGYLVTNGAYTPTSARVHKITLHSVAI